MSKLRHTPFESRSADLFAPDVQGNPECQDDKAEACHGRKRSCVAVPIDPGVRVKGHEEGDGS